LSRAATYISPRWGNQSGGGILLVMGDTSPGESGPPR
jgi:hypothetical protein